MWKTELVKPVTGEVMAEVHPVGGSSSWEDEINGIPTGKFNLAREEIAELPADWLTGWRAGAMLSHRVNQYDPWTPIIAGPFVEKPTNGENFCSFSFAGIQQILARRNLIHEWSEYPSNQAWKAGAFYKEGSWGEISWAVIEAAMRKPRGYLPIVHGTPTEIITDGTRHALRAPNWDIDNSEVWGKILKKIRDSSNGPDMRLRPQYAPGSRNYMQWVFEHGTHRDPYISHDYTLTINQAAEQSPVGNLDITQSDLFINHRTYASGAGEGEGTLVFVSERLDYIDSEMPLLENTAVGADQSTPQEVLNVAAAQVRKGGSRAWQVGMEVMTDFDFPLHRVRVGAPVRLKVVNRHPFASGWVEGRIYSVSGSVDSEALKIEIKEN